MKLQEVIAQFSTMKNTKLTVFLFKISILMQHIRYWFRLLNKIIL